MKHARADVQNGHRRCPWILRASTVRTSWFWRTWLASTAWYLAGTVLLGGAAVDQAQAPVASDHVAAPVYCPVCGAENKAGSRFCLKDGTPLPELNPARFVRNFHRATETYSQEEIQAAIHQAARSVVRIRVKAKGDFRYPDVNSEGRGYVAVMEDESKLVGSGFVIDLDGSVVTNAHVAAPFGTPAEVSVDTTEGASFPAKVLGVDPASDLAVLRAEGLGLPALSWGDSESVELGEETWALGDPLDIGLSLTRGTISSMVRIHVGMNQVENFLHSDAFSTSGNSGGPLVSVRGLVLGVNDMGFVGSKGQGYSIPSRMASLVVERLRSKGTYQRGFLGLQIRPVDSELIERFSIRRNTGIVVESVLSGTPAEAAGFKPGDVIFGINGRALPEVYIFQEAISSVGPNGTVQILLDRGGKEMGVSITTGLRPAVPRIDPVSDLERHIQARFVEDPKKQKVYVRVTNPFSLARLYGFTDGIRVESVLPAQNWTEKPLNPVVFRAAHPIEVRNLADLRGGLKRMYLEGRIGVALGLRADRFAIEELVINALVLEEKLAIIV